MKRTLLLIRGPYDEVSQVRLELTRSKYGDKVQISETRTLPRSITDDDEFNDLPMVEFVVAYLSVVAGESTMKLADYLGTIVSRRRGVRVEKKVEKTDSPETDPPGTD